MKPTNLENIKMEKPIKQQFEEVVKKYVKKFEEQTGTTGEPYDKYDHFEFADMHLSFEQIMFVVDEKVSFDILHLWYWFEPMFDAIKPNLQSFVKGCPIYTAEQRAIGEAKIKEYDEILKQLINEHKRAY